MSAALAAAVAACALVFGAKTLPRKVVRPVRLLITGLHGVHSGHLGDYAAWLMVGTAVIIGLVTGG